MILKNNIALVTGASRGIGKAIALELAKNGADVIVNYNRDEKGAAEVAREISKLGRKCIAIKSDVSNYDDVNKMCNIIKEKFKKLNIVVNNAGITMDRTLKRMSKDEWNNVINVNLNGIYNVTKNVLPLLEKNSRIISISSIIGVYGNFGQTNYAASKAGIIGFTKTLAKEMAKYGTTVNAIAPGFIESEMTNKLSFLRKKVILWMIPLKRTGLPEEVAHFAVFLSSENASYITGQIININGGLAF